MPVSAQVPPNSWEASELSTHLWPPRHQRTPEVHLPKLPRRGSAAPTLQGPHISPDASTILPVASHMGRRYHPGASAPSSLLPSPEGGFSGLYSLLSRTLSNLNACRHLHHVEVPTAAHENQTLTTTLYELRPLCQARPRASRARSPGDASDLLSPCPFHWQEIPSRDFSCWGVISVLKAATSRFDISLQKAALPAGSPLQPVLLLLPDSHSSNPSQGLIRCWQGSLPHSK